MNITNKSSIEEVLPAYPVWFLCILWLFVILMALETILGNLMVLLSFYIERSIRQPSNYFVASLAFSDFLIGVEGFPIFTLYVMHGEKWILGRIFCEIWLWLDYTICLVSILTVLCITIDRYYSVCYAAKYRRWISKAKVNRIILLSWLLPALLFGLLIFAWEAFTGERSKVTETKLCIVPFMTKPFINLTLYITYYWTVLIAIIILYRGIHKVAAALEQRGIAKEKQAVALMSTQLQMAKFGLGVLTKDIGEQQQNDDLPRTSLNATSESIYLSPATANDYGSKNDEDRRDSGLSENMPDTDRSNRSNQFLIEIHATPAGMTDESTSGFHSVGYAAQKDTPIIESEPPIKESREEIMYLEDDIGIPCSRTISEDSIKSTGNQLHPSKTDKKVSIESSYGKSGFKTKHGKKLSRQQSSLSKTYSIADVIRNPSRLLSRRRRKTRAEKKAKKAFRMITVIVGAFFIFWSPYYLVASIYGFCAHCVPPVVFTVSYYMCYLNSSINPFCYALANEYFRRVFQRILRGDWKRK